MPYLTISSHKSAQWSTNPQPRPLSVSTRNRGAVTTKVRLNLSTDGFCLSLRNRLTKLSSMKRQSLLKCQLICLVRALSSEKFNRYENFALRFNLAHNGFYKREHRLWDCNYHTLATYIILTWGQFAFSQLVVLRHMWMTTNAVAH